MKRLLFALALISTVVLIFLSKYEVPPPAPAIGINQEKIFEVVQKFRLANKLPVYKELPLLCRFAELRLEEIKTDWSHDGFFTKTRTFCGVNACRLGENLAKDFLNEKQVLNAWLASPLHAKNLYDNFEYSCIRTDGNYVVHIFGSF